MKWLIFTGLCVAALITLGILAVDARDVVWEGRQAYCPYCRTELNYYAVVCPNCKRSLDWAPKSETCKWCLDSDSVDALRVAYESIEKRLPEAGVLGEKLLAEFPDGAYFEAMRAGACPYCGGIGIVRVDGKDVVCPVCHGTKVCIACRGRRYEIVGDKTAHLRLLERRRERALALARPSLLLIGGPDAHLMDRLLKDDIEELHGYAEVETLKDAKGRTLVSLGIERARDAFRLLAAIHKELDKKPAPAATKGS